MERSTLSRDENTRYSSNGFPIGKKCSGRGIQLIRKSASLMNSASKIWTFAFLILFGYAASSSNAQPSNADRVEKNQLGTVSDSFDTRKKNDATDLDAILRSPPREYIKDLANVLSIEHTENINVSNMMMVMMMMKKLSHGNHH